MERSRRSALFKTLESTRKYRELSERLIELEKKVRKLLLYKWQLLTKPTFQSLLLVTFTHFTHIDKYLRLQRQTLWQRRKLET